jgi:hypothetical protein
VTPRSTIRTMVAALGVAFAIGGCGSAPPSGAASGAASAPPATTAPATTPMRSGTSPGQPSAVPPTGGTLPSDPGADPCQAAPGASGAHGPTVDAALLELLPTAVDGIALTPCPAAVADMAGDPGLAADVRALGVALYASLEDYAVATLARVSDGAFSEAFFRDWRDSFETGVCEAGGGVDPGRSEFQLAGRTVYRSSCAGGVVMYQLYLDDQGVLVSIQGVGPRDLGRQVVAGLKE